MKSNKLTLKEKYILTSELEMILSSGLQIYDGLYIIQDQLPTPFLKEVVLRVQKEFEEHGNFYEAIKNSQAFDTYMEQMIFMGEQSGHLDSVMKELSQYYERQEDMQNQLKEAATYPLVLLVMMFVIVAIMVYKVLPIFQDVLQSMGTSLTSFSKAMMDFGVVFGQVSFFVLVLLLVIVLGFGIYSKMKKDSSGIQTFLASFFMTKRLYRSLSLARLTYAISLFVSSGYPMEESVKYLCEFISHPILKKKMDQVKHDIEAGDSFVQAILKEGIYDGTYANMLAIGERTGHQDEVLDQLSHLYQRDVEQSTSHFLNVIEPTIIALLSLIVGIILLSIMLPLMSLMSSLG